MSTCWPLRKALGLTASPVSEAESASRCGLRSVPTVNVLEMASGCLWTSPLARCIVIALPPDMSAISKQLASAAVSVPATSASTGSVPEEETASTVAWTTSAVHASGPQLTAAGVVGEAGGGVGAAHNLVVDVVRHEQARLEDAAAAVEAHVK